MTFDEKRTPAAGECDPRVEPGSWDGFEPQVEFEGRDEFESQIEPEDVAEFAEAAGYEDQPVRQEQVGYCDQVCVSFNLPTTEDLVAELNRVKKKSRSRKVLVGVFSVLVVVAAVAVLLATRFLPVLQVYGDSMSPTLREGDIVVALDYGEMETGDVIAFCYNNKVLIRRVIADSGDWVNITDDGTVSVNGAILDEPYVTDKSLGNSNIAYPYQVPESHVFVLGDHRSTSVDSRNTAVGCIAEEVIVGELVLRVWPSESLDVL